MGTHKNALVTVLALLALNGIGCGEDMKPVDDIFPDPSEAGDYDGGAGGDDNSATLMGSDATKVPAGVKLDPDNVIDDFEDGNDTIADLGDRVGDWYTFHDDTKGAKQVPGDDFKPVAGGAAKSKFALQTTGSGFTDWGAGVGADLTDEVVNGAKKPYDVSAYKGITLLAKGNTKARLEVVVSDVLSKVDGGTCTDGDACDDPHGIWLDLTSDWQRFTVPFEMLMQKGEGKVVKFDKKKVVTVQFSIGPNVKFDVMVDNISLY
jgi:hypothetical protein